MKRTLRYAAVILFLAGIGFWAMSGANRGWNKTSIAKKTVDAVTGIEGITYEKKFVPGVEFLAEVAAGAAFLFGASLLFPNKKNRTVTTTPSSKHEN